MRLGSQIRRAREEAGLTQEQLCRRAAISRKQLSTIENDGNLKFDTLVAIVEALPALQHLTIRGVMLAADRSAPSADVDQAREIVGKIETAISGLRRALLMPVPATVGRGDAGWAADLISRIDELGKGERQVFLDQMAAQLRASGVSIPDQVPAQSRRQAARKRGASGSTSRHS
jgi:transcriptional regulator with XRE-family HTH domain